MLYYLDTNIVVYAVGGQPAFQQRARDHIAALDAAGHRFAVSELTWTECLVFPLRMADGPLLMEFYRVLCGSNVTTLPMTAAVQRRAAMIRGIRNYGLADSLHLATASEAACDRFLTNDHGLAQFADPPVELLP